MRALRLTAWQHEPELVDVPEPEPGPGQVVVRVGGAGACHSDLHLMHDFEPGMLPWQVPFTLGHENAGWVGALGSGVTGLEIGQPVAVYGPWGCGRCERCAQGLRNYCDRQGELSAAAGGLGADGGMAPLLLVPDPSVLVPLRELDPVDAAPLTDAGLTPYHAIKRALPLLVPGSSAVVIGIGGLGHMAVQLLEMLTPSQIIAVDQRPEALALAERLGAHRTVLSGADSVAEIRGMTGGQGAELVLDLVGAEATLALASQIVRVLGHLTIVGIAGGTLPVGFFVLPYEVSVATTYWGSLPELMEVLTLAEAGKVRSEVERVPLDRALDAYDRMARGELTRRAVIVPDAG